MVTTRQRIGIPEVALQGRDRLGEQLQSLLVDLISLSLGGKQAHWHVTGEHFLPVHEQLDRVVEFARKSADDVAERAITLGQTVDGSAETVAKDSEVEALPLGWMSDREAVTAITERLDTAVLRQRQRLEDMGRMDLATQDLVLEITRGLEKHLWMLQAQLS